MTLKIMAYDNDVSPWWTKVRKPASDIKPERRQQEPDLNDDDIDVVVYIVEARIKEINSIVKEHSIMPRGAAAQVRNGLPFLKSDNLTTDKQRFEILWAGTHEDIGMQNKFKAALLLKVQKENGGAKFLLSLNDNSPVLEYLDTNLGNDETQWKAKKIFLFNEVHPVTEQKFMRCEVAS